MRTIGDQTENVWGDGAWSGPAGTGPFNATWANIDNSLLPILIDTSPTGGTEVGPNTPNRYFGVWIVNPLLGATQLWGSALWGAAVAPSDGYIGSNSSLYASNGDALFDYGVWEETLGAWQDLSGRVRGVTWSQGVDQPGGKPAVGTATITLDNRDGNASPWNNEGDFAGPGARSWLRAGALVRFGVIDLDIVRLPSYGGSFTLHSFNPFFTGRIETIAEDSDQNVDSWVTLTVTETTTDLAAYPGPIPIDDGAQLSATLLDVLKRLRWEYQTSLVCPEEDTLLPETTLGDTNTQTYATQSLVLLADGMHWSILADGWGRVQAVRRHIADGDSGIVFSNAPSGTEMPVIKVNPYSSKERVLNEAQLAREGGQLQILADTGSRDQFGLITENYDLPRTDLVLQTDDDARFLGERLLSLYAWDDLGIDSIDLDMDMDPVNLPDVLTYLLCEGRSAVGFHVRWVHPSGSVFRQYVTLTAVKGASVTKQGGQIKLTVSLSVESAVSEIA